MLFIADVGLFLLENWLIQLFVRLRFLPRRLQLEANLKS